VGREDCVKEVSGYSSLLLVALGLAVEAVEHIGGDWKVRNRVSFLVL